MESKSQINQGKQKFGQEWNLSLFIIISLQLTRTNHLNNSMKAKRKCFLFGFYNWQIPINNKNFNLLDIKEVLVCWSWWHFSNKNNKEIVARFTVAKNYEAMAKETACIDMSITSYLEWESRKYIKLVTKIDFRH